MKIKPWLPITSHSTSVPHAISNNNTKNFGATMNVRSLFIKTIASLFSSAALAATPLAETPQNALPFLDTFLQQSLLPLDKVSDTALGGYRFRNPKEVILAPTGRAPKPDEVYLFTTEKTQAWNMMALFEEKNPLELFNVLKSNGQSLDIKFQRIPSDNSILQDLFTQIDDFNDRHTKSSYEDRKCAAVFFLANLFRDVEFNANVNLLGVRTPVQMYSEGGISGDFAFGRYAVAKEIGIEQNDLLILFYASEAEETNHINMALKTGDSWTVIDGAGKTKGHSLGQVFVFTLLDPVTHALRRGDAVPRYPILAVREDGIVVFDSFVRNGVKTIQKPATAFSDSKDNICQILVEDSPVRRSNCTMPDRSTAQVMLPQ